MNGYEDPELITVTLPMADLTRCWGAWVNLRACHLTPPPACSDEEAVTITSFGNQRDVLGSLRERASCGEHLRCWLCDKQHLPRTPGPRGGRAARGGHRRLSRSLGGKLQRHAGKGEDLVQEK